MQENSRIYKTTSKFWNCFNNLPDTVQRRAKRKFDLFKRNPRHPSLEFEKLGIGYWRVKVGEGYRSSPTKINYPKIKKQPKDADNRRNYYITNNQTDEKWNGTSI